MEPQFRPGTLARAACLALALSVSGPSVQAAPEAHGNGGYAYLSPRPGAQRASPWNNVVLREGSDIDAATLAAGALTVRGTLSGVHDGETRLSDDGRTIVFLPRLPFALEETVVVHLEPGFRTTSGRMLPPLSFAFRVARADPKLGRHPEMEEFSGGREAPRATPATETTARPQSNATCNALPPNYIPTTLLASDDPAPGRVFLSPITQVQPSARGRLLVLDNHNMPLFFRDLTYRAFDFKRQPNGLLTYYYETPSGPGRKVVAMNDAGAAVGAYTTGNGYITDAHDSILLPNGHALLMAYDWQPVDMSVVVPGGDPFAIVAGLIVQELDASANVVFQWSSWDHVPITDVIECNRSLTGSVLDYVHGNSIEIMPDGNLLVSCRNLSVILKISRTTGDVLWRLGSNAKQNDFTFIGDPRGFSHQHDARLLPDGHLTVFDNGNCLVPEYSRALEYEIDEVNMTATLVWSHRATPDIYGGELGSMRRQADGASLINWGSTPVNPNVTEVHADGTRAWEIGFGEATTWTYRAFRFDWDTARFTTAEDSLDFGTILVGEGRNLPLTVANPAGTDLEITCFASTDPNFSITDPTPITVPAGGNVVLNVNFLPTHWGLRRATVYLRSMDDTSLVARAVPVSGKVFAVAPAAGPATTGALAVGLLALAVWTLRRRGSPRPRSA